MSVYYATKAYVLSFSEALSEELAGAPSAVACISRKPASTQRRLTFIAACGFPTPLSSTW